jgi:hypothetical protein
MDHRKTALFREVNDSMNTLLLQFHAEEQADFFCECPLRECARRVALTRSEYEGVRRSGGFLVSPDCRRWSHEVLRTPRYVVVEDFRTRLEPVREASPEPSPSEPSPSPSPSPSAPSPSAPSPSAPSPGAPSPAVPPDSRAAA